jgi:hypothetical protein
MVIKNPKWINAKRLKSGFCHNLHFLKLLKEQNSIIDHPDQEITWIDFSNIK